MELEKEEKGAAVSVSAGCWDTLQQRIEVSLSGRNSLHVLKNAAPCSHGLARTDTINLCISKEGVKSARTSTYAVQFLCPILEKLWAFSYQYAE